MKRVPPEARLADREGTQPRATARRALDRVERAQGREIELRHDFSWELPDPELWDVLRPISAIDQVGSLCDDLEFLRSMDRAGDSGPAFNLVHAAPLLRYLGEMFPS